MLFTVKTLFQFYIIYLCPAHKPKIEKAQKEVGLIYFNVHHGGNVFIAVSLDGSRSMQKTLNRF